jgi:hypothetical protein
MNAGVEGETVNALDARTGTCTDNDGTVKDMTSSFCNPKRANRRSTL